MSQLSSDPSYFVFVAVAQTLSQHVLTVQLIFMSRHEFLVATSIGVLILHFSRNINFLVETLQVHSAVLLGRDINYLLLPTMSSLCVATSKRCRDMMVALLTLSQQIFSCHNSFCWAYYHFYSRLELSVVTSKLMYYRITCRDLKTLLELPFLL